MKSGSMGAVAKCNAQMAELVKLQVQLQTAKRRITHFEEEVKVLRSGTHQAKPHVSHSCTQLLALESQVSQKPQNLSSSAMNLYMLDASTH